MSGRITISDRPTYVFKGIQYVVLLKQGFYCFVNQKIYSSVLESTSRHTEREFICKICFNHNGIAAIHTIVYLTMVQISAREINVTNLNFVLHIYSKNTDT